MLRAFFINATSFKKQINQVRIFLCDNPTYDLFGVVETRLDTCISDDVIRVRGFKVFRQDRNLAGGGVALYVRKTSICEFLTSSDTQVSGKPEKPEYLFCSVKKGDTEPLLVSVICRPPGISFTKDSDVIDKLRDYCTCFSLKLILGDLNADFLKDGYEAQFVCNLSSELSLQVVQHGATNHHTRSSHTWIHLILDDENDTVLDVRNIPANFHSTNNIIDVSLTWVKQPLNNTRPIEYRRYKDINPSELAEVLCLVIGRHLLTVRIWTLTLH